MFTPPAARVRDETRLSLLPPVPRRRRMDVSDPFNRALAPNMPILSPANRSGAAGGGGGGGPRANFAGGSMFDNPPAQGMNI